MKAIFYTSDSVRLNKVFNKRHMQEIKSIFPDFSETVYTKSDLQQNPQPFCDIEHIFTTWGVEPLTEKEIKLFFPNLKCVFHAAGTVQKFGRPFMNCGVKVHSAWAANAIPVAEYTVAQIVLANKGFYTAARMMSRGERASACRCFRQYPGCYDSKIGIIGAGMIGKLVIRMLKDYRVDILVFDPFLPDETATEMGVKKVSLQELFSQCHVISNHLADNENTKNILNYDLFSEMIPYSTFLNTGRGAQVLETDLIKVLKERADITAVLDVTFPEPPVENSPLYNLSNCILTPHIAGASGNEFWRLADYAIDELKRFLNNEPRKYEVTLQMLETMA